MKAAMLACAVASMLIACSGSVDPVETPSAGATRVFVEAVLARLDSNELALVRSSDLDRIIRGNSPDLISSLGGIAEQGVPLVVDPASSVNAQATDSAITLDRFEVTPTMTRPHAVRLDMKLNISAEGSQHSFIKADFFSRSQLMVWDTDLKTPSGESIVVLVQPTLIESEGDLKEILARRAATAAPGNR